MDTQSSHPTSYRFRRGQSGQANLPWLVAGVVVAIALVIAIMGAAQTGPFSKSTTSGTGTSGDVLTVPASGAWAAVFLGDNEVFFGHVKTVSSEQVELTNVYYLQKTTSGSNPNQTQSSQLSLAGLVGNQIQCPTDDLVINRNAVLYYQQLQPSSYVVTKLQQLIQTPQKCVQPASASPTPAAN